MEYFLLILLVVVVSVIWQRVQHIRDMRLKAALTDFVNKIAFGVVIWAAATSDTAKSK